MHDSLARIFRRISHLSQTNTDYFSLAIPSPLLKPYDVVIQTGIIVQFIFVASSYKVVWFVVPWTSVL